MSLNAVTYFSHLKAYLNEDYVADDGSGDILTMKEKYYVEGEAKPRDRVVKLSLAGPGLLFRLDHDQGSAADGKGNKPPLFHFLNDQAKPWSKRCDFVIFHVHQKNLCAECIEFKSKSLSADNIVPQLRAGVSWCRSLKRVIEHYTGDHRKIRVRKFLFADNKSPGNYVSASRQLTADPSIRYYQFEEVDGRAVTELQNNSVLEI